MCDAVGRAIARSGHAVLVEGEPGIGKTALVAAALDAAGVVDPLRGICDPMGGSGPYAVLLEALGPAGAPELRPWLAAGGGAGADGRGVPFGAGEALLAAFDRLDGRVVVLEDLHWADPHTLALLAALGRSLASSPVAVVCTARPVPRPDGLAALVAAWTRRDVLTRVGLGPLRPSESLAVASAIVGAPVGARLAEVVDRAGGNPLFVREALADLKRSGAIAIDASGAAELSGVAEHASLSATLLAHVGYLRDGTRHLLRVGSVLGVAFHARELSLLTGAHSADLLPLLAEAHQAGVLVEAPDGRLAFAHDLIREAIYQDTPATARAELHRDAARHLWELGAPPALVAGHVLAGEPRPEDVSWLVEVAAALGSSAPNTAVALQEVALGLLGPTDPRRPHIEAEIVATQLAAGNAATAERNARALLDGGPPEELTGRLSSALTLAMLLQGRIADALAVGESNGRRAGTTDGERAEQLAMVATASILAGDPVRARRAARAAREAATASGNRAALLRSLVAEGHLAGNSGSLAEADSLLREAVELSRSAADVQAAQCLADALYAVALSDTDRLAEARHALERGRHLAESAGFAPGVHFALAISPGLRLRAGELDDAAAELEAEWAMEDEVGSGWQPGGLAMRGLVALWTEGPEAARAWVARAEEAGGAAGPIRGMAFLTLAPAALCLARGDEPGAWERLTRGWAACTDAGMVMDAVELGPMLTALAVRRGEDAVARSVEDELRRVAQRNPAVASLAATAALVRGTATRDVDLLVEAATIARRTPQRLLAARASEAAAGALAGAGRRGDAAAWAAQAVDTWSTAGATSEARRAAEDARRAGVALRRPARGRPTHGPEALTPTERAVAAHLADGLSNPDIARLLVISRRTVETHVSHILTKLGLSSRTEVILAAARGELRLPTRR